MAGRDRREKHEGGRVKKREAGVRKPGRCGEEAVEARSAMFPLCGFARRRGSTRARERNCVRERVGEDVFQRERAFSIDEAKVTV